MAEYTECEALLAYIEDYACNVCRKYRSDYNKLRCEYCSFGFCIDGINKYKTTDVKPVIRGYWIENEYEWICSRCGESFEYYDNSFLQHAHFCPNCGAKICPE